MKNWIRLCCLVSSLALLVAAGSPQGLGKGRGQSGGQSGGGSQSGGSKSGGQSSGGSQTRGGGQSGGGQLGDLGKSRGGGQQTGGSSSVGGLGRGSGGGQSSGGSSSGGGLGRGSGGGQSSGGTQGGGLGRGSGGGSQGGGLGDLGKGRPDRGGSQTGGGSQGGGLGRGSGGSQGGGGLGDLGKGRGQGGSSSGGSQTGGGLGRGSGGNTQGGGLGDLGKGRGQGSSSGGSQQGGLGRGSGGNSQGGGLGDLGKGRPDQTRGGNGSLGNLQRGRSESGNLLERSGGGTIRGRLGGGGGSNSGGNNNVDRNQIDRRTNGVPDRFQTPNLSKGSLGSQVLRQDRTHVNYGNNIYYNGYRTGYCQYNNRWQDNWFSYPHYVYSPWGNNCTVSPWYYYSNLPAYIVVTRTVYVNNYQPCRWGQGDLYSFNNYNGGYGYNRNNNDRYADLDDAVYDIQDVFERGDKRALDRLIPRSGRVAIYSDGSYAYSLNGDDFYDLLLDNVYGTDTTRYEIYQVYRTNGGAQVYARHYFRDAFGREQTVMHQYGLRREGRDFVITDFSTGYRFW